MLGIMAGMTHRDICLEESMCPCSTLRLVCTWYASVYGVEEFDVFERGKWTLDPVVDPRPFSRALASPLSLVFSTLQGFFYSPLYLAVTCTVFGVRLWSAGLWTSGKSLQEWFPYSSLPWFDSGYMLVSVYRGLRIFCVKMDLGS